jgi:hypothetical protein
MLLMNLPRSLLLLALLLLLAPAILHAADSAEAALRRAVVSYASFDEAVKLDYGGGAKTPDTRFNDEKEKGKFVFEQGFDAKVFRVLPGKGIAGGALQAADVLPRNGRIFFPARGNIGYRKGGWGGALSVWINTDPNKLLKTKFCDPIQITQKGANNGGIWFDFNDAKPRDLRMGIFPAVAQGQQPLKEEDPQAPMVRVPGVGFTEGAWHHVVLSWRNLDTGRKDGEGTLWIDGKKIGTIGPRELAMDWDLDKTGIYFAVNYVGLLDELAIFNRPLTPEEVALLHKQPALLAPLKNVKGPSR